MSRVEVAIRVPVGAPLPQLAAFADEVEQAGLDGIGVPDHHHTGRDAYLALAAMAGATSGLRLFPATSNTVTRHPLVLAALASSLDELAPGRGHLTVAPGFLSVEKAGLAQERRERLRRVVLALRGLLDDGEADLDGTPLRLFHRPAGGSRVHVLASGPRLLELAGEVADAVLDAFGAFGSAQECAERLLRAHEEVDLRSAFLFPVHSWDTTYDLPRHEVAAFGRTIGPALRAAGH